MSRFEELLAAREQLQRRIDDLYLEADRMSASQLKLIRLEIGELGARLSEVNLELKRQLREGNTLRAKLYRLKDGVFENILDREKAVKAVTGSSVMRDYVLFRQGMRNLDIDPDSREDFQACVQILRRIHAFHFQEGHTHRAFPEDAPN